MYWALAWDNQSKLSGFEEPNPFPASRMGTGLRSCESRVALHQDLSIRCKRSLDIVLDFHAWQARASWWRVSAPVQVNITHLVKVFCNGRCPCYKVWVKRWNKWWNRERDRERETPCRCQTYRCQMCMIFWSSYLHGWGTEAIGSLWLHFQMPPLNRWIEPDQTYLHSMHVCIRIEDRMSWSDMVCEIEDYSVSHLSSFWKRSMRADHHRHALGSSTLKRSYHSSLLCSRISVAPQFTVVSFVCLRKSNWRRPCRSTKHSRSRIWTMSWTTVAPWLRFAPGG